MNWYKERYAFKSFYNITFEEFGSMIPFEREVHTMIDDEVRQMVKDNDK